MNIAREIEVPNPTSAKLPALTVNLGALTTTFAPPRNCASMTLANYAHRVDPSASQVTTLLEYDRGLECSQTDRFTPAGMELKTTCFPERWAPAFNNIREPGPNAVWPVYSPGLLCPSGYATECTMVYSQPGAPTETRKAVVEPNTLTLTTWSVLAAGEVGYGCCPSGFRCYGPYTCVSIPSTSETLTVDMSEGCRTAADRIRTTTTQVVSSDIFAFVYAPQVVLIQRPNSTNADVNATAAATSSPSDTPGAAAAQSGLSTAAKAAVGAAVPLVAIILALAVYVFYRRRNRIKNEAEAAAAAAAAASEQDDGSRPPGMDKPELDATPSPFGLSLSPGSELDGTSRPSPGADFDIAGRRVSELPGSAAAGALGTMCELPGDELFAQSSTQPRETETGGHVAADQEGESGRGLSAQGPSAPSDQDAENEDAEKSSLLDNRE
ncbi:uncharacterized protein MAM_00489 [Metarhizium album ARSEF 1941]|uniref:Uncharacterized protein n=1 Tax=Metarhizium album (strain ARSEF 1941) TaxID=1081103 RepID=A0A0B2X6U8_METAS|nr:uncharacterized protein MAM_00489 [Metarhizium album ARSEF 1941]KHO01488.1 hypothetical protein MAM_00489 [Metarhizium album ARSEF 1941]